MTTGTATARRPRARTRVKRVDVTPDDFDRVERWLNTHELVERAVPLRLTVLCALVGGNLHLLGPPGIAKSHQLREFARSIIGAIYFEKPMNAGLPPDLVIGTWDIPKFMDTGQLMRRLMGFAPGAHVLFFDEEWRANGPMKDALLPMENVGERHAEQDGGVVKTDIKMLMSASNSTPDPDDLDAGALLDRKTMMFYVERIQSDENFMELIERVHVRELVKAGEDDGGRGGVVVQRETITLEQMIEAQRQVKLVRPTPEFKKAAADLRRKAFDQEAPISDRRWLEVYDWCRGVAWRNRRDFLIPEDLAIAEHALWREKDGRTVAAALVQPYKGRFEQDAVKYRQEAYGSGDPTAPGPMAEWEQLRPVVEETPPMVSVNEEVLRRAMQVRRKIQDVKTRIEAVLDEAAREQRDAAELHALHSEILVAAEWYQRRLGLSFH